MGRQSRWRASWTIFSICPFSQPEARVQNSSSDDYPNREESLSAVRDGFLACGGTLKPVCRVEANGVESWGLEKDETRTSGWMKGGHTQPEWCANLLRALQAQ